MTITSYRTKQGEMLDLICWRHYGARRGVIERVLEANPGLADGALIIAAGTIIGLPDLPQAQQRAALQKLWD